MALTTYKINDIEHYIAKDQTVPPAYVAAIKLTSTGPFAFEIAPKKFKRSTGLKGEWAVAYVDEKNRTQLTVWHSNYVKTGYVTLSEWIDQFFGVTDTPKRVSPKKAKKGKATINREGAVTRAAKNKKKKQSRK